MALIDVHHLNQYVAGDRALRDEILAIYEQQVETWAEVLNPMANDTAWRDAAHALKGASRGVGAWEIGQICEEAEGMIGPEASLDDRADALNRLRDVVRATINEVRRLRQS
ncbi:hypothetical protein PB2503_11219 [Parvularcula bermudensis HTCC2503]|uniref:HPt domain-containing protein n=1 Tax=Parvularcula bermudensis (strain ATCC BAA-594 / HTCC2503 / KCTC 12087) TaxID=314260 RepID=E0TIH2_PARBH|nr:Hpt domain-containing protein [Parvularcula bermudensis]ADM10291.1 hypothetical protein PB2503_11219 [Parvularcula bermudensis HTCC2503]